MVRLKEHDTARLPPHLDKRTTDQTKRSDDMHDALLTLEDKLETIIERIEGAHDPDETAGDVLLFLNQQERRRDG
ncbi:MAG: hypothetical protein FWG72_08225 [Oscillospiraceae bacterium]|nr:hypothetical protein [Oscillospiraceae bacterium]